METSERVLVLNLLRDGKISADQAERLLRSIHAAEDGGTQDAEKSDFRGVADSVLRELDSIGLGRWRARINDALDEIAATVADFRSTTTRRPDTHETDVVIHDQGSLRIAEHGIVVVSAKGAQVSLSRAPGDDLDVRAARCQVSMRDGGMKAELESAGDPLEVDVPDRVAEAHVLVKGAGLDSAGLACGALVAEIVGGKADLSDTSTDLDLNVSGGGARVAGYSGARLTVRTSGGGIDLDAGPIAAGEFQLHAVGGAVTLSLEEGADFDLRYDVSAGVFESEWDTAPIGDNRVRVGSGKAKFRVSSDGGSIMLRRRQPEETPEEPSGGNA